jgi:ABC-type amino acid transport substrate-binding protein
MLEEGKYEVVSPLGERDTKWINMAPRLDTLEGKTICELWNESFKTDITFPAVRELLQKKYPGVKIIPYNSMPRHHMLENPGVNNAESEALIAALKEKGCDAVISGNGG